MLQSINAPAIRRKSVKGKAVTPEQRAREQITRMIEAAGWTYREEALAGRRDGAGFADYLLIDGDGAIVAVLEAKAADKHPLVGKEQARDYAASRNVAFVMLSNGREHYLWDTRAGDPEPVLALPSPQMLANRSAPAPRSRIGLWETAVDADYLQRAAGSSLCMRPYQVAAIQAVQRQAREGATGFLLEMATGTGKTTVAAALCFLYLNTRAARRILFLVDRIELRQQARDGIRDAINNQYTVNAYAGDPLYDWERTRVSVASVQSLEALAAGGSPLPADYFDLIITDEAHRCISGPHRRRLFEHFSAEKIGLTATPRALIAAPSDGAPPSYADDSTRAREQEALRDTYLAFRRPPGEPTYAYTIEQGVGDGYLVRPTAVDVRTEVTAQLMSDAGYQVTLEDYESGRDVDLTFHSGHFAQTFISPGTNDEFAQVYIDEALREPGTDLIGKGIIYAVNQRHAAALTQALNRAAAARWPGRYQSDFAVQVTSHVDDANAYGQQFRHNNLNGRHPGRPGYNTAKTRVCVTVAMMTTGYDCRDLLNVGICRPIKSPTDFTQIKGRGTRTHDFRQNFTDPRVREQQAPRLKERFKIIDFFGVCEYHHEGHYYEPRVSAPPGPTPEPAPEPDPGPEQRSEYDGGPTPGIPAVVVRHGPDATESITRLELADDARTIAERREVYSPNHRALFEAYRAEHPVADADVPAVRAFFDAYAANPAIRDIIDRGNFAALAGTGLTLEQYRQTPAEHRRRIPAYIRRQLPSEGPQAAA